MTSLLAAVTIVLGLRASDAPDDASKALRSVPGVAAAEVADGAARVELDAPVALSALRSSLERAGWSLDEKKTTVDSPVTLHIDGRGADCCALLDANHDLLPALRRLGGEARIEDLDPRLAFRVRYEPGGPVALKDACDRVRKSKAFAVGGGKAYRLADVTFHAEKPSAGTRWQRLYDLTDGVKWETDPDEAMARAQKENRPVFLFVTADC
jgi:hypothetical protein